MYYRRNPDADIRDLERRWLATNSEEDFRRYINALLRQGEKPYQFVIHERMPTRDSVYYDGTLQSAEKSYSEAQERDPDQTYYAEPEFYIKSRRHPDGIPRWEDRGPWGDKEWDISVHFYQPDGTVIDIWLGHIYAYKDENFLKVTIKTYADLFGFDERYLNAGDENQEAKVQKALHSILVQRSSQAFQYRALANIDVPLGWNPMHPVVASDARALNLPATDPSAERSYNTDLQLIKEGMRTVELPDEDFLVPELLLELLLLWLEQTPIPYGQLLEEAIMPLELQLRPDIRGRQVTVYRWKSHDGVREIEGSDDPTAPEYQQHRYVYDVSYNLVGRDFHGARFHRWEHDDGFMASAGWMAKPINATAISFQQPSEEAHEEAERKAVRYTAKKLEKFKKIAEKWGYWVRVIDTEPPYPLPKEHTWRAGMQYPLPGYVKEGKEPEHFR